jgi:hypothetical protein
MSNSVSQSIALILARVVLIVLGLLFFLASGCGFVFMWMPIWGRAPAEAAFIGFFCFVLFLVLLIFVVNAFRSLGEQSGDEPSLLGKGPGDSKPQ